MIIDLKNITTLELAIAAINKLEGVVVDTQKYVGQLERGEVKGKGNPAPAPAPSGVASDPEYLRMKASMAERNMRDDRKDAETKLREEYGDKVYDILSLKYDKFAKEQIRAEASTVQFFTSCFELIFAREMKDKDSELLASYNKTVKPPVVVPPVPGADVPPPVGDNPPPPITGADPAGGNPGGLPPVKTDNTEDAFKSLEKTLAGYSSPYDN